MHACEADRYDCEDFEEESLILEWIGSTWGDNVSVEPGPVSQ
jgi:hypothetical protein